MPNWGELFAGAYYFKVCQAYHVSYNEPLHYNDFEEDIQHEVNLAWTKEALVELSKGVFNVDNVEVDVICPRLPGDRQYDHRRMFRGQPSEAVV